MTGRAVGASALVALFLLALFLRIGFAIDYAHGHPLAEHPVIDEASYERWALDVAGGDWIGDEVFFQEPLYPYWLASIYSAFDYSDDPGELTGRRTAARHAQAFLGALAVVLVVLVTESLFGRTAALVAGVAMATYRPLLILPSLLLKANLLVPLLLVLVALALMAPVSPLRWRGIFLWLVFGLAAGLGALLRGNVLVLLPLLALLPLARAVRGRVRARDGLGCTLAALAGMALVLAPVAARNHAVGGVLALTTSGAGTNLYGGNNAENPYGRATELSWVRGIPEHEAEDWKHEAERRTGRLLDPGAVSSYWIRATLDSVRADPKLHLRILWNKLRLALGAYEVPDNHHIEWDARFVSALRLPIPGYGLWGMLGLAGMAAFLARRFLGGEVDDARGALELCALYALYLGTIVLTVMSDRARLALVPMLLPLAGFFVASAARCVPARDWAGLALRSALLVPAALAVHWPVLSAAERALDLEKRDYNRAVYLLQDGELDQAAELIAELERAHPGTVQARLLEAELAYRRGAALLAAGAPGLEDERCFDAALGLLRPVAEGADVAPRDRFRARKLAGLVSILADKPDAAERRLREALAFDPNDRDVRFALANALWMRAAELAGAERAAALSEARGILSRLRAEEASAEVERRLAEVDAALVGG